MDDDIKNYSIAGRYRTARKNLDALGYKQTFSLDSLPLIELLLVDLAQTKETLKHFKSIAEDNLEACSQLQQAVDPYKCDNAKLVQECNEIHQELIEAREENQRLSNDYKKRIRQLESELNDHQLSFSKNLQRIKQLELESSNKTKRILELQGKCCKPTINNSNLANKKRSCYPLRKPILEAEPLPRTTSAASTATTTTFSSRTVEPCVIDFVSMADHRIHCLSNEVAQLKEELFLQNEHAESLKSQLCTKENEVSRLRKMLEGGRPYSSVNKDHCCLKSSNRNSNDELMNLQRCKLNLEKKLKESLEKQHEAMTQALKLAERNEELENELKDVDRIALAVEADCNSTVKENNKRVTKLQEKMEHLMTQVQVLESELTIQRREAQELRADLEACRLEKSNIQRCLDTTREEKKQMNDKINHLTMMESNLNCEIDHLRIESETLKRQIRILEQDKKCNKIPDRSARVELKSCGIKFKEKGEKAEINARKKCVRTMTSASKSPEKSSVYQEKRNEMRKASNSKQCSCRHEEIDEIPQCNIEKRIHDKNIIISSLQSTIEMVEAERDHYKCEYMKFKDQFKKDTGKDNEELWSQVCELRAQVSEKEHMVTKLLREKKDLCHEKFDLESKLRSCKVQQTKTPSPCNYCRSNTPPSHDRQSFGTSSKIEKLERERDIAVADVHRLIEERDALRERLKLAMETHLCERRRHTEKLDYTESRLLKIEQKWRDLLIAQESRQAATNGLEHQLEDVKEDLRKTKLELTEQRTQYFQVRNLQDQTDQALADVQGQLAQCENELALALDKNKNVERQHMQYDNQVMELKQEINTHRCKMAQLDREKDQLLMDLDEKTERIAALERELNYKEQQVNDMEQQVRELTRAKEISFDQAADMERQMMSTQLDLENLKRELTSVTCERESAIQQNRQLQDDLASMSCEVRNMHQELEASKVEACDLKRQLQTYVCEVRRAEELLSQKENERTEMLNHFRSLSLEASVLENNNHSLENEAAEVRGALQACRDQIVDLERQLTDKDCLITGCEDQIIELTENVARLEIQLQQATEERQRTENDLRTARDLCMTLEQQKECLSQRLTETSELKIQYEQQIARYKSEQDIFQDQLERDHCTIDRLEKIIEDTRKEAMNSQSNGRELQCEVARMKQKISELQTKLCLETKEMRKYQTQAAEYSKQICDLRRQVTNERFERAKMQECGSGGGQSRAVSPNRSEHQNKKENTCSVQSSSRPKCCQCNKPDDGCTQQTHRCRIHEMLKSQETQAIQCDDVLCIRCRDEIKVSKTKAPIASSDCLSLANNRTEGANKNNNVAKPNEEKQQQLTRNNSSLSKNLLCGAAKEDNLQPNTGCHCNGKSKASDINCKLSQDIECKLVNLQTNLSKDNLSQSLKNPTEMTCGCTDKAKPNLESPCWIIQTLNRVNKLLEEKGKKSSQKSNSAESSSEGCSSDQSSDKLSMISGTEENIPKQKNESGIYTGNSFTQTEEIPQDALNPPEVQFLQILNEIQHYAADLHKYFREIKNTQKSGCDNAQQCQMMPQHAVASNKSQETITIPEPDATLPLERLSDFTINFEEEDIVQTSTPQPSPKRRTSGIPLFIPRCMKQSRRKTAPIVDFDLSKDQECPALNANNDTNKTEYKSLPEKLTVKTNRPSRLSKFFKS